MISKFAGLLALTLYIVTVAFSVFLIYVYTALPEAVSPIDVIVRILVLVTIPAVAVMACDLAAKLSIIAGKRDYEKSLSKITMPTSKLRKIP